MLKNLCYASACWAGRRGFARKLSRECRGLAAILMYHRVMPAEEYRESAFNRDIAVTVERFEEQVAHLAATCTNLGMEDMADHLERGEGFAVAVTFDDGYRDNLTHALPILKQYNVPATIYVTTGFTGNGRQGWWHALEELCRTRQWLSFRHRGARLDLPMRTARQRQRGFAQLRELMLTLPPQAQDALLEELGRPGHGPRLFLDREELLALDREPLITIGAHTRLHPDLRLLSRQEGLEDIQASKTELENILGHAVLHFSYPHGACDDPDATALSPFFRTSLLIGCRSVQPGTSLHRLPRHPVLERDTAELLELKLTGWEHFLRASLASFRRDDRGAARHGSKRLAETRPAPRLNSIASACNAETPFKETNPTARHMNKHISGGCDP